MPLPQQVINQLSREPSASPGWASGVLLFCAAIFAVAIVVYLAIAFAFTPIVNGQISSTESQISQLSQQISSADQANLVTFYSQVSNLQMLLKKHIFMSQFFAWLEANTEAHVSYAQFSLASAGAYQITVTGNALSEADINQQVAIFQSSPMVRSASISAVSAPSAGQQTWQFSASLIMNPALFTASST